MGGRGSACAHEVGALEIVAVDFLGRHVLEHPLERFDARNDIAGVSELGHCVHVPNLREGGVCV